MLYLAKLNYNPYNSKTVFSILAVTLIRLEHTLLQLVLKDYLDMTQVQARNLGTLEIIEHNGRIDT